MPGMDGVETTRRIKSLKAFEEIPVLMITARDEVSGIQDALDAGAVDYLVKPVEPTALLARVRSALRTRHAIQQVRDLNQDLLAQKKELSNFTHMVSHDLKSPVVGAASLFNFFLYRLRVIVEIIARHARGGRCNEGITTTVDMDLRRDVCVCV